jgi:hypothetical protein
VKIAVLPGDGIGPEIIAQAVHVLERLGLGLEMEEAPVGGAGYEASGDPLPARTLAVARSADANPFWRRRRPALRLARAFQAAGAGDPRAAQGARPLRQPASRARPRRAGRRVRAAAGDRLGSRSADHPRADRRHLLRPPEGHPRGRGRARRLRHDALPRKRGAPDRRRRVRGCARKRCAPRLLGRQGECTGDLAAVAGRRDRRLRRTIPTSSSRTCT